LEKLPLFSAPAYSLKRFLLDRTRTGIIANSKASLRLKNYKHHAGVIPVTSAYASYGASGLSCFNRRTIVWW
jgi:hypothetical protein